MLGVTLLAAVLASGALAAGHASTPATQRGTITIAPPPSTGVVARHADATPALVAPAVTAPALVAPALGAPPVAHGVAATAPRAHALSAHAPHAHALSAVAETPAGPWSPEIAPNRPAAVAATVAALGSAVRAPSGPRAPPAISG
jgi:hypothetical protein